MTAAHRRSTPWLLIAIGIGFALITAWSFQRAFKGVSSVTDPDYYSHGLRYNRSLLEQQRAESLGWQLHSRLDGKRLQVTLAGRDGVAVTGARGSAALIVPGRPQPLELPLAESSPGSYLMELPDEVSGELVVDLAFNRDGAGLQRRLLVARPRR